MGKRPEWYRQRAPFVTEDLSEDELMGLVRSIRQDYGADCCFPQRCFVFLDRHTAGRNAKIGDGGTMLGDPRKGDEVAGCARVLKGKVLDDMNAQFGVGNSQSQTHVQPLAQQSNIQQNATVETEVKDLRKQHTQNEDYLHKGPAGYEQAD